MHCKKEELMPEFMFADEASEYLCTTERKISLYRRYGLLKWSRLGKNYVYKKSWLDAFMEEWAGFDLSNEQAVRLAINAKKWKESHHGNDIKRNCKDSHLD